MINIFIGVDDKHQGHVKCQVNTNHSQDIAVAIAHIEAIKQRLVDSYIQMTNEFTAVNKSEPK